MREAQHAEIKPDFIHKMSIALKECNETEYWLLILRETGYFPLESAQTLIDENTELLRLLTSIIKSSKQNPTR